MQRLADFLKHQPAPWLYIAALALMAAIVFIDYKTGYEVTIYPFYSIPLLLMVWFGDLRITILISVACAIASWAVDKAEGHVYSSEWLRAWDATVRLMFFSLVLFAGCSIKRQRDEARARIELLERSQRLEDEIIGIREREQQRIGRDLHDGVCQYLAAIGLTASMLKQDLEKTSARHATQAGEITAHLREAATRVRQLARGLSPVDRDEEGLESAFDELAVNTTKLTGISCAFVCSGKIQDLSSEAAVHLFRIAQEAVNNAVNHSHGRSIIIALDATDGSCSLRVSDDGRGFIDSLSDRKGMGLSTMQYRSRMLGGDLEIQPNSPSGTVVTCTVPVNALRDTRGYSDQL